MNNLLLEALAKDPFLDLNTLKEPPNLPIFSHSELLVATIPPPPMRSYIAPEPTGFQKLLPGAKEKYAQQVAQAQSLYNTHFATYSYTSIQLKHHGLLKAEPCERSLDKPKQIVREVLEIR